jgi:aminopeptidase N
MIKDLKGNNSEQSVFMFERIKSISIIWKQIKSKLFAIGLVLLVFNAAAQLTSQKKQYTLADTLRGSLRPERTCYDVNFYELNIRLDTLNKCITGSNKIAYTALTDFEVLQIDLFENMRVISIVNADGRELKYQRKYNAIFVEMGETIKAGTQKEFTVNYYGVPTVAIRPPWDGGFVWSRDNNGKLWVAVSCEGIGASLWWPNKDHLSDEPDSMRIICTIPQGLKCIANGKQESEKLNDDATSTFSWMVSYPINNYNVTLNIGDYEHFSDEYIAFDGAKLELDYYVMTYNIDKAKKQFEQVKPMLRCYEKYLGKYPFWNDGYALVETPYLGMEHQGAIAYGNKYKTGYAGSDYSRIGLTFDYIIIHETGHEWWGNSVSCSDIADMWIHESFCTYTEAIYVECMFDSITALKYINAKKSGVDNKIPVVGIYGVNEEGDGDMYSKGMLFLNTLRHVVNNDALWWATIKNMSDTTFKFKNTNYDEVVYFFNRQTELQLSKIFEQYLKHSDIPVLNYQLKKKLKGRFELKYKWEVNVKGFEMPFVFTTGSKQQRITANDEWQSAIIDMKNDVAFKVNDEIFYIQTKKKL